MANGSNFGIIGIGIAGLGLWVVGNYLGWWSGIIGTTVAATTLVPIVSLVGPVTTGPNNSLQGTFSINGATQLIAVSSSGSATDNSGNNLATELANDGISPAQLYAMLSAAYTPPAAPATGLGAIPANYVRARYR